MSETEEIKKLLQGLFVLDKVYKEKVKNKLAVLSRAKLIKLKKILANLKTQQGETLKKILAEDPELPSRLAEEHWQRKKSELRRQEELHKQEEKKRLVEITGRISNLKKQVRKNQLWRMVARGMGNH